MIEFPPYRLDPRAGRLWRGTQPVALRPKAWELLRYLVEHSGALVTKDELHAAVWGDTVVSDDTLTRTLAELRRALRDDARTPRIIETVHRRRFRFIARLHGSAQPGRGSMLCPLIVERGGTLARASASSSTGRGDRLRRNFRVSSGLPRRPRSSSQQNAPVASHEVTFPQLQATKE